MSKKYFLPKIRLIECGTLPELELMVNQAIDIGYKIQSIDSHKNEFFQSHSAILVRSKSALLIPKTQRGGKK